MSESMTLAELMNKNQDAILKIWLEEIQAASTERSRALITSKELVKEARNFADAITLAFASEEYQDLEAPQFLPSVQLLQEMSANRAKQGFTPSETVVFVLSLKKALIRLMQEQYQDLESFKQEVSKMNDIIDQLALVTFETFVSSREEIIQEQSQALVDLSTPVIKLWDSVLLLPLVGIIDTLRSQNIIMSLLKGIVTHQAQVAILDVTGVPMMDTRVANHLINTVDAAKMLGSEVVLTGISADAAQTLVRLNVDLSKLRTSGLLKNGIKDALNLVGLKITEK